MKTKERPEDFLVRERYELPPLGEAGPFAIYKVEKRGLSTIDASVRLGVAAGVATDAVRFAGLKDRQAVTVQLMSVEGGREVEIRDERMAVVLLGFSARPITAAALLGNEFEIVLRDLGAAEARAFGEGLRALMECGLPNYFDDQRFGAARAGKGFPARELVRGDAEGALRLLVATPSAGEAPEHARRREELAAAWGDWERCAGIARGWHEQEVFRHLAGAPGDFRGALRFVPRRERLMQLFAYQSHLWNRALDRLVRARHGDPPPLELGSEVGPRASWRSLREGELDRWVATGLPLPSAATDPRDPEVRAALEGALGEDGLRLQDLAIEGLRGFEFREEARDVVLLPEAAEMEDPEPDEFHPGREKLRLRLALPKGAYATLVLKRAALG